MKGRNQMYIRDYFEIDALLPPKLSNVKSFLARILNRLTDKINEVKFLPKYLVVFLDKDLITEINVYDYGIASTIEDTIKWLLININIQLDIR